MMKLLTRMKTFLDGGGVDEISAAQHAHQVRVQVAQAHSERRLHPVE